MFDSIQIEQGFAELPGERIYYEKAGAGEPLVFLHGGLLDRRMWDEQFQFFAQHYQVIRYDVPGAGNSSSIPSNEPHTLYQEVADLLTHLGIGRASLVGLSGGARLSIDMALAYPERVHKLVLVSPGMSGYEFVDEWTHQQSKVFEEEFEKGNMAGAIEAFLVMWVDGPFRSPQEVPASVRERCRAMATQALSQGILTREWRELEPPAATRLAELQAPTLVILGEKDTSDIHAIGKLLRKEAREVELVELPAVAHALSMETPAVFNTLVYQFLQR